MDLTETQGTYNLLEEKWIPVLYVDGKTDRLGIIESLKEAQRIRQIAASNPMDRVALLRFLMAVLLWCKENAKSSLAELEERGAGIPGDWLVKLEEHRAAFDLLGDGERFYQDKTLPDELLKAKQKKWDDRQEKARFKKDPKTRPTKLEDEDFRPVGDLLVEFPGGDSVNHMRHVFNDGSYGFCPACCAMGILRLSVWAPANRHYPASVNPGSAAYAYVDGKDLFRTLYANLPETNPSTEKAPWLSSEQPGSLDAVTGLAWRPRRLWLNAAGSEGNCENCGAAGEVIKNLCIQKGWATPITEGQQFSRDVLEEFQKLNDEYKSKKSRRREFANKVIAVASVILKCRRDVLIRAGKDPDQAPEGESDAAWLARVSEELFAAEDEVTKEALIKNPTAEERALLSLQDRQVKKFWPEDPLLLKEREPIGVPSLDKDVGLHASKFWRDASRLRGGGVIAVGVVGDGQYVFHDTPVVRLPSNAPTTLSELTKECADILGEPGRSGVLRSVTNNPHQRHAEINSALKLLTPNAESQIQDRLSRSDYPAGHVTGGEKAFVREVYEPVVERVIASVTPGSPLRRREAMNKARGSLRRGIDSLVGRSERLSSTGTSGSVPGESKGEEKKGDSL